MLTLIARTCWLGQERQVAADMLEAGEVEVLVDVTGLVGHFEAGAVRGPDGRYPVRSEDDPALSSSALYAQAVVARFALEARAPGRNYHEPPGSSGAVGRSGASGRGRDQREGSRPRYRRCEGSPGRGRMGCLLNVKKR